MSVLLKNAFGKKIKPLRMAVLFWLSYDYSFSVIVEYGAYLVCKTLKTNNALKTKEDILWNKNTDNFRKSVESL